MSDVWAGTDAAKAVSNLELEGVDLTGGPMDVPTSVWHDFKNHIMGYVMAGLGYFVVTMVVIFVAISAILLGLPGVILENEALMLAGTLAGFSIYTVILLLFAFIAFPLMNASLIRTLDMQRRGEHEIGVLSLFSHARQDAGKVIIFYLMSQTIVLIGFLMLYIPGFIAALVVTFSMPILVLEDIDPVGAVVKGFEHVKDNAAWHIAVWLMLFATLIIAELTIVGLFVILPVMAAWQVHSYRLAFPDEA